MKTLRQHSADYLKLRRQLGYKLKEAEFALRSFVNLAEEEGAEFITTKLALWWAAPPNLKPAQRGSRLSTVRRFAAYVSAFDPRTQVPAQKLLPYQLNRRNPFHYTDENVTQLINASRQIDSSDGIKGQTLSTVLGLLAVTGMRVGEAVVLDCGDFDPDKGLLTIRLAKGSKSRVVPLHPSTTLALRRYASVRDSIYVKRTSPAFFVWEGGDRLVYSSLNRWFLLVACQTEGLEELVRVRTREIVAAYQSKGEFMTNISHELMTPLNGILGMTELLLHTALTEDQIEMLTDVQLSSNRLLKLVDQILRSNSVASGGLKLQSSAFGLHDLCKEAVQTQAASARAKGLSLDILIDDSLPPKVEGDREQIRQIIALLLDNAVKFTDKGAIRISVQTSTRRGGGIEFSVVDTGCGISEERLQKLRSPFAQVDGSLTRSAEGIGMGLTLAKQLLSLMGSELAVESSPGTGSTFRFTVPPGIPAKSSQAEAHRNLTPVSSPEVSF